MLSLRSVSLRRGTRLLFQDVNLRVHAGYKVGITGANGTGKSSLLALMRGELHADAGDMQLPDDWVIAHVAQETPAVDRPAIEYVMDGDTELRRIQSELNAARAAGDGLREAHGHSLLEIIDGYTAAARAARLMRGLGFTASQEQQAVRTLSGGWRMRLNLAQALMCRSDLLLLDEPTNHLDLDAVIWLQDWLRAYAGTLVLISHDRDFLDEVVEYICHFAEQGIRLYSGNYSAFERQRAEALAQQQASHEKQQREIDHMQSYVDRFRAKASKARQAQSRLKALERLQRIAPAHVDSPFHFRFGAPDALPNPLLTLEHVDAGYAGKVVLGDVNMVLAPGARIGLLGRNGAGKSTLVQLLAGSLSPISGMRAASKQLRVGYFAQHQLEQLHGGDTALAHLRRLDAGIGEQQARDYLGGFGFSGDMALAPAGRFSGGEKARLVLALVVYERPNLLLLDEPTNHLDLDTRLALTMALQEFDGAMVVVSHDRYLLRSVSDTLMLVAHGEAKPFGGDLDDYRRWLMTSDGNATADVTPAPANGADARRARRQQDADQRRRLQPLRQRLQQLERALDELTAQQQSLEQQLLDPSLYADANKERVKQLLLDKARVDQLLRDSEEQWLQAGETLEQAERNPD